MEVANIRFSMEEDGKATIYMCLNGLNCDIIEIMELYHYVDIEDLVHQLIKVEQ